MIPKNDDGRLKILPDRRSVHTSSIIRQQDSTRVILYQKQYSTVIMTVEQRCGRWSDIVNAKRDTHKSRFREFVVRVRDYLTQVTRDAREMMYSFLHVVGSVFSGWTTTLLTALLVITAAVGIHLVGPIIVPRIIPYPESLDNPDRFSSGRDGNGWCIL